MQKSKAKNKAKAQMVPEIAFYYPNPFWRDGDWIKNLILFFDGIGLLVPKYMKNRLEEIDPAIVAGLREHKLLHVFEPEKMVDKKATERLAEAMVDIISSGALDKLATEKTQFAELSMSRLGYTGDAGLAEMLHEELMRRKLAVKSKDGVSIPMHPMIRSLVLVLLSQILRVQGLESGIELAPATDMPKLVNALQELLSVPQAPSAGNIVAFDLNAVGVDLGSVPIDEVLSFRKENFAAHRKYARAVRLFVYELSCMPAKTRAAKFQERKDELDEIAASLRRVSRKAWKGPASFALSMLGAAWTFAGGNPIGAILAGTGAMLKGGGTESPQVGAYSYLFNARSRYY